MSEINNKKSMRRERKKIMRKNNTQGIEKKVFFSLTDTKLNFAIYRVETFLFPHLRNKLELNFIKWHFKSIDYIYSIFILFIFFSLTSQTFIFFSLSPFFLFNNLSSIDIMAVCIRVFQLNKIETNWLTIYFIVKN